ncbi:MAG: glycosyltransferase, partial [Deltaproteobacteria bacterium]
SISLCGNFDSQHLGFHFKQAASQLQIPCHYLSILEAQSRISVFNQVSWRWDKTYFHQRRFQNFILKSFEKSYSKALIVSGTAPVTVKTLQSLKSMGVKTVNFVSDDPWNNKHQSNWFLSALSEYTLLATPRKSNLEELKQHTDAKVIYLPFAYNPKSHFESPSLSESDYEQFKCDLMFFGGADEDRLPYIRRLIQAGINLKLYGGYWDRYPDTRPFAMGIVSPDLIRTAVKASKVILNIVRKANRDGHVMRSFEVPAMGGCMLTEETQEHLEIFGRNTVPFFKDESDIVQKLKLLLESPSLRNHYATQAQKLITLGKNTYADRLKTMLDL